MIIFSYFFLLFLTILLVIKSFTFASNGYAYRTDHITPFKNRYSLVSSILLCLYSIYLFSNHSIYNYKEEPNFIIFNFLYKKEPIFQEYLKNKYEYEDFYEFKLYYFDNYDFYFINNFLKKNKLINKYKTYYEAKNKNDFLSKIKIVAESKYDSVISDFKDKKELKEEFYNYLNNDGFISEFEFNILNENFMNLKSTNETVYNFCIYSKVFINLKNQCYKEYKEKGFITIKTENTINPILYKENLYLDFIDYQFYLKDIRNKIDKLNDNNLLILLEKYTKDDFFSRNDYKNIQEEIKKIEKEINLNSEAYHYQNIAANFVIDNNGKTKDDILKMKEKYGYLPNRSKELILVGLESLIEGFDENKSLFIFEYYFEDRSYNLSTINYIIEKYNCDMLIPLRDKFNKDNIFTEFEYEQLFKIHYDNCKN